jgi:hypothetical protein
MPKKEKRDKCGGEAYSHHKKGLATEKANYYFSYTYRAI